MSNAVLLIDNHVKMKIFNILHKRSGLALLTLAVISLSLVSCRKEKDTIARVTVIDEASGLPVGGATVKLYGEPSDTLYEGNVIYLMDSTDTDASGVATFNFSGYFELGQAGFAVLTVDVTRSGVLNESIAVMKVEEEVTNELTVEVP